MFHQHRQHRLECLLQLVQALMGSLSISATQSQGWESGRRSWNQHAAWLLSPDPTRPAAKQVHCVQNNLSGPEAKEGKVMPTFLIGHGCRTNWCSWLLLLLDQVFHQFWFNGLESLIKCWWSMPNIKMHYKSLTAFIITLRIHSFS